MQLNGGTSPETSWITPAHQRQLISDQGRGMSDKQRALQVLGPYLFNRMLTHQEFKTLQEPIRCLCCGVDLSARWEYQDVVCKKDKFRWEVMEYEVSCYVLATKATMRYLKRCRKIKRFQINRIRKEEQWFKIAKSRMKELHRLINSPEALQSARTASLLEATSPS